MRRARLSLLAVMLFAGACDKRAAPPEDMAIDAGNPLAIAARPRGVARPAASAPPGVFERIHELGRDAMCVVPDGRGEWRFAMTAAFGTGLSCRTRGRIEPDGEGWRFTFAGVDDCSVILREEEDELRLPGKLPSQCDSLCPGRATLAGLRLPRASWSADDARGLRMRDGQGNIVRPCGD